MMLSSSTWGGDDLDVDDSDIRVALTGVGAPRLAPTQPYHTEDVVVAERRRGMAADVLSRFRKPSDADRLPCNKRKQTSDPPPLSQPPPRRIPGPAGALLSSTTSKPKSSNSHLRERPQDSDLENGPWLAAVAYLDNVSKGKSSEAAATMRCIKTGRIQSRIKKLVAVIKMCTPNGCGDVLVCLKDPSGTIGGIIHRKVMAETEFGRDIEPGAAIVLHEVAIFSPTPMAHYLNITVNNVEQVFRKGFQDLGRQSTTAKGKDIMQEGYADECCHGSEQPFPFTKPAQGQPDESRNGAPSSPDLGNYYARSANCSAADKPIMTISSPEHERRVTMIPSISPPHQERKDPQSSSISDVFPPRIVSSGPPCPSDGYEQLLDDTDIFECLLGAPTAP